MAIPILHEDKHIVAVSKPSGQVVIPGRGEIPGVPLNKELEMQLGRKVFVVHRLDRGASGIVLFAKDAAAHRRLSLQFENREIKKTYLVLAQGRIESGGKIEHPLRAFGSGRMGIDPKGKPSLTEYTVRESFPNATLLEVTPSTGRRHQIRVHLFSIGHPVMGDTLYGKDRPVGGAPRLMLHAWKLAWAAENGERIPIEDDIPLDFRNVLK
jgi:tRNA pseudouridine32 synthase/23S rRNA pseudouridine746 synthase